MTLIILDTPPVKNALDFLESPGKMAQFVDKRVMKWFLQSSGDREAITWTVTLWNFWRVISLIGTCFWKGFFGRYCCFLQFISKGCMKGFMKDIRQ